MSQDWIEALRLVCKNAVLQMNINDLATMTSISAKKLSHLAPLADLAPRSVKSNVLSFKPSQALAPRSRMRTGWQSATCLLFLAACLLGLPRHGLGDTYVGGTIAGETWEKTGSPYRVTNNVFVALLTINPGVMVHFEGNYQFEVGGSLTATGTVAEPIIFTRTNGVGWKGIFFNYSYDGSEMDYCNVSGVQIDSAIKCVSANPVFRSCVLFDNVSSGEAGGLYVDNRAYPGSEMLLQSCTFSNNTSASHGGAVSAYTGTNVIRFVNCSFVKNTANAAQVAGDFRGGGVFLDGNGSFDTCSVQGNTVYAGPVGNYGVNAIGGGIDWLGQGSMRNTFIRDNMCLYGYNANYGGGLCLNGSFLLQNCVVGFNTASGGNPRGGGIRQAGGDSTFVNCTIAYNNIEGFRLDEGSATILNSILFFNNGNGAQIVGSPTVNYSDIQNSYAGIGNIASAPVFAETNSFMLIQGSRCIDAGDSSTAYNDGCRPPALGTIRNDMGAYGGPGACCWDGSCTVPVIRAQPQGQAACIGSSVTFGVGATGSQPITYQWRFHGTSSAGSPTNILAATNATYTISNVESNNAGYYSVRVSNPLLSLDSSLTTLVVTPVCVSGDLYMGLTISGGVPGQNYRILSSTDLTPPVAWTSNATIQQTPTGVLWIDTNSPANKPKKFYLVTP